MRWIKPASTRYVDDRQKGTTMELDVCVYVCMYDVRFQLYNDEKDKNVLINVLNEYMRRLHFGSTGGSSGI
jgi:hypothetical protein